MAFGERKRLFVLACIVSCCSIQLASAVDDDQERFPIGMTFRDSPSHGFTEVSLNRLDDRQASESQRDNVQRILFKEVDADGKIIRPLNNESWRRKKIEQLLEELANSISLRRNSRTYQPAPSSPSPPADSSHSMSGNENFKSTYSAREVDAGNQQRDQHLLQKAHQIPTTIDLPNARAGPAKIRKSDRLIGALWTSPNRQFAGTSSAPTKPAPYFSPFSDALPSSFGKLAYMTPSASFNAQRNQMLDSAANAGDTVNGPTTMNFTAELPPGGTSLHHAIGKEELILKRPTLKQLLGSSADYEAKRTETRWNNLRGMWGKRSISEKNNLLDDKFKERPATLENAFSSDQQSQ